MFPLRGTQNFIRSKRHRDLGDPVLSKAIIRCRWLYVAAISSWLVFAAGMFYTQ